MKIRTECQILIEKLKNGLFQIFSANIVNKAVVMLSNMVITRLLSQTQYGIWSYVLNIYSYASLVTGFGLASGAFQFGAENQGKRKEFQVYKYCLTVGLFANVVLVFLFGAWTSVFEVPIQGADTYIRWYLPILLLEYFFFILQTVIRCQNRMKEYARILNYHTVFTALFTCVGALAGVGGVVIGKYVATIAAIVICILFNKEDIKKIIEASRLKRNMIKEIWYYSIPIGICSAVNRMIYLIDVSMIGALIQSAEELAVYKVATLIPNTLTFIPSSVILCVLPSIIANNQDVAWLKKNIKRVFMGLGALNVFIGIVLVVGAPIIITIISGAAYLDSVHPFRILTIGYIVTGTFRDTSVNILAGLKKVNANLIISIISGVSNIGLNYMLIKPLGIRGAAYATLSVEVIASVIAMLYLVRTLKKKQELVKE